ncbi:uncharacterized protein I206_106883 [Kwoniella pini CBS 10737]|uniref:WSC domain-containing protein n=1 Tax=Kwoniella pini CBS 10737 TaxID=1296096 RepID=A0A1B9HZV1_9TREE|nr:uncharacterized protein I206_05571 [Kwoniella pini CBS 10737]OCF48790.1 hypothetical protein I206_05571 [Kwoniella pini CBS 10737]
MIILVTIYLLINSVTAYTFIGCTDTFSFKPQASDPKGYYAGGDSAGCAAYCSTLHTPYFYNQYNTGICYCSNVSPKASQFTYGASELAGCEGDSYEIYALNDPVSSLSFQGCYTGVVASLHPGGQYPTIESCLNACSTGKSIMFSPNPETGSFDCNCDTKASIDTTGNSATTCGQYTWFTYLKQQTKKRVEGKRRLDKQLILDVNDDVENEDCEEEQTIHVVEEVTYVYVEEDCKDLVGKPIEEDEPRIIALQF